MWDQKTGRSRGFGFVSFRSQQVLEFLRIPFYNFLFIFLLAGWGHYMIVSFICSLVQDAQSAINDLNGKTVSIVYFLIMCCIDFC